MLLSCYCSAAATLQPDSGGGINLAQHILYLEDPEGNLRFNDIQAIPITDWQSNSDSTFSKGYTPSTWWLRLKLTNPQPRELDRYLEITYPNLDYIKIHSLQNGGHDALILGDNRPFDQRPIKSHNFVIPLTLQPESSMELLLQIRSSSSLQVPLFLWSQEDYIKKDRDETLLQGFYFGVMIVMGIYNLFVYLAVREKNFLYYVCFVFAIPMFIACVKGFAFEYLWPNHPEWNEQAIIWSLSLAVMFGALFTESFLKIDRLGTWAVSSFRTLLLMITILLLISVFLAYRHVMVILIPLTTLACLLGLVFGIMSWRHGGLSARYYTLGWSAFLMGGIALGLNKLNIIPSNILTENTLQIASNIEVILLSFALAESINEDRRLRSEAQQNALDTERDVRQAREEALLLQQQLTAELETRVQERTRELEVLNRQLAEISDTDPLTQLNNRRYLDRMLKEEITRCSRYHHPLSVVLIDVDHFKQFNDNYGHLIGDECLKMVGTELKASVREAVDCAVRYGGEEFCLMLPETNAAGAMEVAERVRSGIANMAFMVRDEVVPVSISLGVASLLQNEQPDSEQLLQRADEALYAAKQAGRNRTMLAEANHKDTHQSQTSLQRDRMN